MKRTAGPQNNARRPRPQQAIEARKHAAASKVAAVEKAIRVLGRTGVPVTRMGVAQLAGVSRSFTYENDSAKLIITSAALSERNQLLRERNELQQRLNGARANISRLSERRVQELFPDGPGPER